MSITTLNKRMKPQVFSKSMSMCLVNQGSGSRRPHTSVHLVYITHCSQYVSINDADRHKCQLCMPYKFLQIKDY